MMGRLKTGHWKTRYVWMSLLGLVAALLVSPAATTAPVSLLQDSPKALVDQAWQIVQRNYVDRTFNQQDWVAVRSQYLKASYPSNADAYRAIEAMVGSLNDPYTRFLTPEALKELTDNVSGDFVGVGLTVRLDPNTREWIVEKTFAESPAANAGLQHQDVVVSLNGKPTPSINPAQAAPYLIGPVGSKLEVTIRRGGKVLPYQLVREHINLNPLTYQTVTSKAGLLGYIRLPIFTTKSAASMQTALKTLEAQNVRGYLLDLRGNPGGVLDAGIAIAQMWIPGGAILTVQERDNPRETLRAEQRALTTKPLVVLIDGQSASASEVLAAALKDNNRAILVGTQTFGKGLVQAFEPLSDSSGVLVTIAKYFTPKGQNINKIGIAPDLTVESQGGDPSPNPGDRQYQAALQTLTQRIQTNLPSKPLTPKKKASPF